MLGYTYADDSYANETVRAPYIAQYILESQADVIGVQEAGGPNWNWHDGLPNLVCKDGTYTAVRIGDEPVYKTTGVYDSGAVHTNAGLIIFYKNARYKRGYRF